jgi:hypothetical protein
MAKWLAATHADPLREIQKSVNTTLAIVSPGRDTNGFVRQVESSGVFFCFKQPSVSLPFFLLRAQTVICLYDACSNVIGAHEHAGDFKEP